MRLTGIEIWAGGRWKFIGKVGPCRAFPPLRDYLAVTILYREAYSADCLTRRGELGIDEEAWQIARSLGARYLVTWLKNKREYLIVSAEQLEKAARSDLGERLQLRVPAADCRRIVAGQLNIGFTTYVIRGKDEKGESY